MWRICGHDIQNKHRDYCAEISVDIYFVTALPKFLKTTGKQNMACFEHYYKCFVDSNLTFDLYVAG